MKIFGVGLNLSLVAAFLFLFIIYSAFSSAPQNDDCVTCSQVGGASLGAEPGADSAEPSEPKNTNTVPVPKSVVSESVPVEQKVASGASSGTFVASGASADTCAGDDIRNPQYPTQETPSNDNKQNIINRQRRLIQEYQGYIKNLRGNCCSRLYSGRNLMTNPLSNRHWTPKPLIATLGGNENALYLMTDDFSNSLNMNPADAEKYKVSFFDQEMLPARTYALNASAMNPMYDKNFDRSFVGRVPLVPAPQPFKVTPWDDYPGDSRYCSGGCPATSSPPWTVNKSFTCNGVNFSKQTAPEPEGGLTPSPPPYVAGQSPPPLP